MLKNKINAETEIENELMIQGRVPIVTFLDNHSQHITDHKKILANPKYRKDPKIVQATIDHIQDHMDRLNGVKKNQ